MTTDVLFMDPGVRHLGANPVCEYRPRDGGWCHRLATATVPMPGTDELRSRCWEHAPPDVIRRCVRCRRPIPGPYLCAEHGDPPTVPKENR